MYQSWKRFTKHVTSYFCGKRESSVLATLSFMFNHCFWQSLLLHQNFFVELQYVLQSCVSVIITNTFGGKTITTYIFWVLIRMLHLKFSIERIIALKCLCLLWGPASHALRVESQNLSYTLLLWGSKEVLNFVNIMISREREREEREKERERVLYLENSFLIN